MHLKIRMQIRYTRLFLRAYEKEAPSNSLLYISSKFSGCAVYWPVSHFHFNFPQPSEFNGNEAPHTGLRPRNRDHQLCSIYEKYETISVFLPRCVKHDRVSRKQPIVGVVGNPSTLPPAPAGV